MAAPRRSLMLFCGFAVKLQAMSLVSQSRWTAASSCTEGARSALAVTSGCHFAARPPFGFCGRRVPHLPLAGVCEVLNSPQGVALVTTRSGQTPPASKLVLGFPGFHHHGNSFGLGTFSSALAPVDFKNWSRRRNDLLDIRKKSDNLIIRL